MAIRDWWDLTWDIVDDLERSVLHCVADHGGGMHIDDRGGVFYFYLVQTLKEVFVHEKKNEVFKMVDTG